MKDVDKLCNQFEALVVNSVTASTWGKHKSAWKLFSEFCIAQEIHESWPIDIKIVRAFAVWAFSDKNLKHSTVKSYISSLETGHSVRNLNCPHFLQDKTLNMILKGAENVPNNTPHCKTSMNPAMLALLGHFVAISAWTDYSKQLLWSLFLMAFYTSCRMGELVSAVEYGFDSNTTLKWVNISITPEDDGATIFIPFTKAKKFLGETVDIFRFNISNFCPVVNILKLKQMQIELGIFNPIHPVFKFRSGSFVTTKKVNTVLKDFTSTMFSHDIITITGHSFRASVPTLLASLPNCSKSQSIKEWGRWSSESYKMYSKNIRKERKILFDMLVPVLNDFWK